MLPYTSQRLQGCSGQALGNCLVGFHVSKDTESQQILNQMLGCRPSPGGAFKYLTSFRGRLIIDGAVQLFTREIKFREAVQKKKLHILRHSLKYGWGGLKKT